MTVTSIKPISAGVIQPFLTRLLSEIDRLTQVGLTIYSLHHKTRLYSPLNATRPGMKILFHRFLNGQFLFRQIFSGRTHAVWTGGARSSQWQQDVLCAGLAARWTVRIMLQHNMLTLRKRQFYSIVNCSGRKLPFRRLFVDTKSTTLVIQIQFAGS